ncbi:TonB-dependent receptor [Sphingomonas rhizophila]|uniref:TonB-dependent receptor n=1 Tax=Sphingomonas rhizophila TaxID=2071607 RepID=A0A7G9SA13_9SPHN|nr:TonB-dependent receptor [Sphingomonas rhizophila]QNN64688.1 TonB-dependent receptor [Sphingomonas rhizophila]
MKKSNLRVTAAWQALALLGAGAPAAFVAATPAAAQDYTRGNIVGTVTDAQGAPVAGAQVTVRNNDQGFTTTTTTDANGVFRATALNTGTYTVTVVANGQTVVEDRGVVVQAGQNNQFAYTAGTAPAADAAEPGTEGGEVVVTGTRVRVDDFASTQTGSLIDVAELASTVPVQRDQTSLILLAPGTTAGDAGFGNLASIAGATVAENAYYVNGLNITDFRGFLGSSIIPFEFYRSIDVKTGGYQAEYGRALGGVTSAVVKAGSNDLKGGAVINWAPNWGRNDSPNTYLAKNDEDFRTSLDANFYLSGPIIKDRLFFYALYNPRWLKTGDTSLSSKARLSTTTDSPFWGGKLDAIITDGHRLEFMLYSDKQTQRTTYVNYDPVADAYGTTQGTLVSKFGGLNYIGTYTGKFTDWLTLSASYGKNKNVGIVQASPDQTYIFSRIYPSTTTPGAFTNGSTYTANGTVAGANQDRDERKVFRFDADVYVNLLGTHHFRAGMDYEKLASEEATTYNGGGYYYDIRNNQTQRRYYENFGGFKSKMQAVYLQDSWSLLNDRLTLNLGVRGDKFRNYSVLGEKFYDSGYNWAPRLGATFDVFGDKRTKITAFYGRYFLPIATNTNIRLGGQELYYRQVQTYANGSYTDADGNGIPDFYVLGPDGDITNFTPNAGALTCPDAGPDAGEACASVYSDGTAGPTDTLVSQNLKPSETSEIILGASHRFGGGWTVGVDFVRRRLLETLEDMAIDAGVIAYCNDNGIAGCTSVFSGFHQYVLSNPGSDVTVRLDGDCTIAGQCEVVTLKAEDLGYPKAVRKYDAVQLTVDKAFNGLYGFNASYTYTKLRGNFEGGVKSDNNQTDTGLTQDFDQPGLVEGAYGNLANGREHAFKFYGHIEPIKGIDIGINAILESPRKFSCIGNFEGTPENGSLQDGTAYNFAAEYGAASYWCQQDLGNAVAELPSSGDNYVPAGSTSYLYTRGTAFKTEWNKRVDLGVGFDLAPLSLPGSSFRVDVFNVFNWAAILDRNEFGDIAFGGPNPDFYKVTGYQAPRSVRFTLAMRFGEK